MPTVPPANTAATLKRRLASLLYEVLLLLALLFVAGFLVVGLLPEQPTPLSRTLLQGYLALVCGVYFVWCWRHGGQTLAMKTWRLRLVDAGSPGGAGTVGLKQAWLRYLYALLGTVGLGIGFVWALWDRDRQFLHDRLADTRLIDWNSPRDHD